MDVRALIAILLESGVSNDDLAMLLASGVLETLFRRYTIPRIFLPSLRLKILSLSDDESKFYFRFTPSDLIRLCSCLKIPDIITTPHGTREEGLTALAMTLRRLSYPCRWRDLELLFWRSGPTIADIVTHTIHFLFTLWSFQLEVNIPRNISPHFARFSSAIFQKTGELGLQGVWALIDGTFLQICRPKRGQESIYNGYKRHHGLKFQSLISPDGIIQDMFGPYDGRHHDITLLRESKLEEKLIQHCVKEDDSF
jgi:hypothetical protein